MQERALRTKRLILEAAKKLFAAKGFHGVSADEIASSAGVSKQRIFAYYKSKAGLFEACAAALFDDTNLADTAVENIGEADIPRLTEILLRHYFDVHERNPDFWRMLAWINLEFGSAPEKLRNIKHKSLERLRPLFLRGSEAGLLPRGVSFEAYIFAVFALSCFYYSNRMTLSLTLDAQIGSPEGRAALIGGLVSLLSAGKSAYTN
jgi:AcrR family transcriptional regulator